MVRQPLKKLFGNAEIEVNHDLLGAARALCGNEKGIAAILGTGSNSCLYDGEKITEQIPSLGYILGDEGSGAYIAKKFIASYLYREMPGDLSSKIDADGNIKKEDVIHNLYHSPAPSAYLAGYMTSVTKYALHPFVSTLIKNCFIDFLEHHVCRYTGFKEVPMHCTGSIAHNFLNLLKEAAAEKKVTVGRIIDKPINTLADFHLL
jgi:N-acetylglucosamine kinase-like BadF-type ATPase